ncbi:G4 quadruplex nucleic acid binding protein [Puttea exsequens]|nr:G4 quadruplex nucleic acid binding protein [Puttea exsequens]
MSSPCSDLVSFLRASLPSAIPQSTTEADLPSTSSAIYPDTTYTENEKVEIHQWLTTSSRFAAPEDQAKHAERLGSLNIHLSTRTTLLGSKPSIADVALYHRLAPWVKGWSADERTGEYGYHHVVRYINFVQNAPLFGLKVPDEEKVAIDPNDVRYVYKPIDPKEGKERKKKEKAAAAAAAAGGAAPAENPKLLVVGKSKGKENNTATNQQPPNETTRTLSNTNTSQPSTKKEKKEKTPKPTKQPAPSNPLSPSLIDLRVGHILHCIPHPNADSLYVSTMACGDLPGTENTTTHDSQTVRTVCSGLNGLIPLQEMQNRKIIAVCNLKPVKMRNVLSSAMVLAASPRPKAGEEEAAHKGPVELVKPPEGAEAGERVWFEGWEGEPEGVLNPKKKVWENLQPGFTTTEEGVVGFEAGRVEALKGVGVRRLVTKGGGVCTVESLKGAVVR